MASISALPTPRADQAYFTVSAIEAGVLFLPANLILDPSDVDPASRWAAPALSFILQHSDNNRYTLFDLGILKNYMSLPPAAVERIPLFGPVRVKEDVAEHLVAGGLQPSDISNVIISHAHWDHTGDPSLFPKAAIIVHEGTKTRVDSGYPKDARSTIPQNLLPAERTRVLDASAEWQQIGPFPRAHDLFGDGSAYIIDAPGHVEGHINLLARTSADGGWIMLLGDACHERRLLTGEARFCIDIDERGRQTTKMHTDLVAAQEHLARVRVLMENPRVGVLLAHDAPWWEEKKGFWPEKIDSL
ncbi:Metallo-hydrolase/oxidoreductase [Peniophora sp. CONT]|nr:Metallo-hydrolase/oxidoreductase [Peniophora sp. CONT]